ncbi:MAG TPA: hypothetical protein VF188_06975 [Longimicrobiales bacterium]
MSGGTSLHAHPAARAALLLWILATLATACDSDPAEPTAELPEPCDAVGAAGDPYGVGVNCRTVEVDGYPREYLVYVPPGYTFTAETPAPVVLMFHGGSGNGERFLRISRWKEKADEVGLIAVFPTGLEYFVLDEGRWTTRWNEFNLLNEVDLEQRPDGYPDDAPWPADDVGFARAMLDDLVALARADPERLYASGFSNGATFTSRLAIEATDRIAAFAYVGGGFCDPVDADWTSAPPRNTFQVFGAADHKILGLIAQQGGPELESMPLDADSILAIAPLARCMQSQVDAYALDWDRYDVREENTLVHFQWSEPAAGNPDRGNSHQFAILAGLDHNYPNGANNPLGWVAVDRFWEFFRDLRLTN